MTWMQFINFLVTVYLAYYAINFLFDLLRHGAKSQKAVVETVHFPDDIPEIVSDDDPETSIAGATMVADNGSVVPKPAGQGEARSESPERTAFQSVGGITDSGGVELKALFELCRAEAIEYQRAITF